MKIWTGKFCLFFTNVVLLFLSAMLLASCSSKKDAENTTEVSLQDDQKAVNELRKDVPDEIKKSNDRLAEMLKRWKIQKTPPERLRELFNDEIRKKRVEIEKKHKKEREQMQRSMTERRHDFEQKQKEERESFYATHPSSDKRNEFRAKQSEQRDTYMNDLKDERTEFEEKVKDEKKDFEDDIRNRWSEFRQEFPEYSRQYNEMKKAEEKEREEKRNSPPQPYQGWPYKDGTESGASPGPQAGNIQNPAPKKDDMNSDVNKGGNGWPSSDMSEFDEIKKSGK